jgi:sterol desaturase/sphingolipid hydroxylase (fatty acid hydroxylase superfamily)
MNMFLIAGVIGWGVLSGSAVAEAVRRTLTNILGQRASYRLDPGIWHIVSTVVVFLTYDFAYWLNHSASHRIGWLWEFRKVHHTAEVLTPMTIGGNNALMIVYAFTVQHLQHSHIWIATTGRFGRVIFSLAHHQIHHSDSRVHFDKNFGACLAIWDWMSGTLYAPSSQRERLTYGCASPGVDSHTAMGALLMPFVHSSLRIVQSLQWRALLPGFQTRH